MVYNKKGVAHVLVILVVVALVVGGYLYYNGSDDAGGDEDGLGQAAPGLGGGGGLGLSNGQCTWICEEDLFGTPTWFVFEGDCNPGYECDWESPDLIDDCNTHLPDYEGTGCREIPGGGGGGGPDLDGGEVCCGLGSYCYGDDDTIAYDAIRIEFSEENCNVIGGEKVGDSMCNDDNDVCCRGRKLSTSDTCQIPDADGNLLTYIKYEIDYDYYEYQLASSCNSPLAVEDSDEKCIEGNTVICCFEKDAAKGLRYNQYTLNECKDFGGEKISEAGDFLVDPEDIKNNKCVEVGCLYADPVTGNMVSEVMRRGNCEDLGGSEDGGTII